jgi:hypothetical protein
MARDLYGELLARALQRRAPPGHFPAFVTPGEANLLRSYGGGVAPGGGQYMAGGIPAFSYGGEAGFGGGGGEGEPGDPGGFGAGDAFGGMTGEFGGMGFDAFGFSPMDEGDMGRSPADQFASFLAARAKAEKDAVAARFAQAKEDIAQDIVDKAAKEEAAAKAAARAAAAMEQQFQAQKVRSSFVTSPITVAPAPKAAPLEGWEQVTLAPVKGPPPGNLMEPSKKSAAVNYAAQFEGKQVRPSLIGSLLTSPPSRMPQAPTAVPVALAAALESDTLDPSYSTPSQTTPGFTGTISEPGTESFFEESLEQDQAPYSGDTTDATAEQMATNLALAATATSLAMDETEAYDAHEAALTALDAPISEGGIGRFSPANSWGLRSEVALNNKDETGRLGISIADLQALNAQDQQGYAINNPQPSEASILASQVFAQLNPTITNAVIGLAGFLPGTVGFAATIAGLAENKGLLNIPGVRSIPGVSALSDALAGVRTGIGDFFSPITDPIGQALSAGQQAVADALSGIIGTEESTGFDDAGDFDGGGVDGGAPDIEIVPDVTTDTDATPPPMARTFADVDDETRRRILANIISGLQRTGRPTEGVTAFGPLFT